ncbi:MAG: hypothetical protein U0361_15645 [Nitrospiraceae bacterium]
MCWPGCRLLLQRVTVQTMRFYLKDEQGRLLGIGMLRGDVSDGRQPLISVSKVLENGIRVDGGSSQSIEEVGRYGIGEGSEKRNW